LVEIKARENFFRRHLFTIPRKNFKGNTDIGQIGHFWTDTGGSIMRFRELKSRMEGLLRQSNFQDALATILEIPGRQAVNPLFSFFYSTDELIRWRAITAMGEVVSKLAGESMESARVIMRRLMWNLNDESGGIGWGSPEAMGEITAGHAGLAKEFSNILISYIDPDGNFLEHEILQRGSLWGVGRLAHARPSLARPAASFLPAFFDAPDPYLRGISIWAASPILNDAIVPLVEKKQSDEGPLRLYQDQKIDWITVGELARLSLKTV
jgi:hypothetical protein